MTEWQRFWAYTFRIIASKSIHVIHVSKADLPR